MKLDHIYTGDCLEVMKELPDNSIDSIVTDPPYGLEFMGKEWDNEVPPTVIWEQCLRILKPGGHLLSFAGTRTQHRMAVNIEYAGFEIRDMIAWVYGGGFPKSLNIGKAVDKLQGKGTSPWEGWGTALKPALEPITVARKPIESTVAQNVLKYGTGGMNIDGCRVGTNGEEMSYSASKKQGVTQFGTGTMEQSPLGRFPANFIHDGSDEVTDLMGSAARFFYTAKASRSERNMNMEGMEEKDNPYAPMGINTDEGIKKRGRNPENQSRKQSNFHPTVKPIDLMQYLVRLVTKRGGVCLDPFMGSGTTAIACMIENVKYIGIEINPEYVKIAKARISQVQPKLL